MATYLIIQDERIPPLKVGSLYKITTLMPPQRLEREHCMTYLGTNLNGELVFNARPVAGTQSLDHRTITRVDLVADHGGREDHRHYMNKVVR